MSTSESDSSRETIVGGQDLEEPVVRRKHTRSGAERRKKQETTLDVAINQMMLDRDPSAVKTHEVLLSQMLGLLDQEHQDYVNKEGLDINSGPEFTYMKEWSAKVERSIKKHRTKLQITDQEEDDLINLGAVGGVEDIRRVEEELAEQMGSVSESGSRTTSVTSTSSKGKVLLHKIRRCQNTISAKATAVRKALAFPGIENNPRAVAKAGIVWNTVEHMRCNYQALLDEACDSVEEKDIEDILEVDGALLDRLTELEAKMEELLILKDSPEKEAKKENLDNAFSKERKVGEFSKDAQGLQEFLRLQAQQNLETERKLKVQEDESGRMAQELAALRLVKNPQTQGLHKDSKSALRLPTCPPVKFSGDVVDYLPWKRQWQATMGKSYVEEVQLMQLKASIPERTSNLIGLVDIRSMDDFWSLMDGEYLDYNQLSRGAIAQIKNLDKKDPRFLQMMMVMLTTHRKNLELSGMGHRITSDEMVREEWLPMLTYNAKEDWLKIPSKSPPLWPHFEMFLQTQSEACKERERLGLVQTSYKATSYGSSQEECGRCKAKGHSTATCQSQFCLPCRSWKCRDRRHKKQRNAPQDRADGDVDCGYCKEAHPYMKHTKSKLDSFKLDYVVGQKAHMQSASRCPRCSKEVRDTLVTCGACGHSAKAGEKLHCFDHCTAFMQASPDERLRQVQKYGDCTICLIRGHDTEAHLAKFGGNLDKIQPCGIFEKQGGLTCTSNQNSAFHGAAVHKSAIHKQFHTKARGEFPQMAPVPSDSGKAGIQKEWERSARRTRAEEMEQARILLREPEVDGDRVLLLAHEVTLVTGPERRQMAASIFYDKGSTCTMVTRRMKNILGLESIKKAVLVQSFGHEERLDTEFVVLELLQVNGSVAQVRAYVVDSITTMAQVDIPEKLKDMFSNREDWPKQRYHGEIEILLGIEELALHPKRIDIVGNLGIFKSPLSKVTVLGGRHEDIHPARTELSQACLMLRRAETPGIQRSFKLKHGQDYFQLGETMGDYVPKTCNSCKSCTACSFAGRAISQRDRVELEYIERGIEYNKEKQSFTVKYPFLEDPKEALTDNRKQALAYAFTLEKKLAKAEMRENFNLEFDKFLETGSLKVISEQEQTEWKGAVHYVPLQLVINEASQSTPFRIVTNTSCRDPITGKSLNSITAKGPNMLSDPYRIMIRFRNRKYAISTDVTKAYHGLRTTPVEMHLRRVVYRRKESDPWTTYGFLCVSFGDIAAQAILECCLQRVAKQNRDIDYVAALIIELDRFVDDLPSGSDEKAVLEKLRGKILDNWQTTGTLAQIMAKGGFSLKVVACSGDEDGPMVQKLGGAVLGIPWNTETDKCWIPLTVNVTKRRAGMPTGPDVTLATIESLEGAVFTRRIVLSATMSLYDPLGWICPLATRLRWLVQQLGKPVNKKGWDDALTADEKGPWVEIFRRMVEVGQITFPRSCKPEDADLSLGAILIYFMDGSDVAKAFAAYIRYLLTGGKPYVSLLAAKSKLNPTGGQSTPRSELDGHTLAARGARTVSKAMEQVTPRIKKVYMLGDSRTILQALKAGATPFNEYFANRLGEIYDCMRDLPEDTEVIWAWVRSELNGADVASRKDADPADLVEGSEWQKGPAFLQLPEEEWPIDRDIMREVVTMPKSELRKTYRHQAFVQSLTSPADHPLVHIASKTNNLKMALTKTRYLSHWLEQHRTRKLTRAAALGWISRLQHENALCSMVNRFSLRYWLIHAGKKTLELMEKGGLKNMVITVRNSIPMVQTRYKVKTKQYFGAWELPLVLGSTDLGYMLCQDAHNQSHRAGDLALSITKQTAYIVGGRKILLSIRKHCMLCRKENAIPIRQRMADIPSELQLPERGFRRLAVDLAGPYMIKPDIRRRSGRHQDGRVKIWVAIFGCSISSAVKLYLCRDYSEEGFMQAWRQHVADWGEPASVHSDRGSQLVSAAGGLDPVQEEDTMDWDVLSKRTGVKWSFTPANAQWRNGRAEALVKCTKHSLRTTFKFVDMDIMDFQTTLKEISGILNSRPVELLLGSYSRDGGGQEYESHLPDSWTAITPQDLLIGDGSVGNERLSYREPGPRRMEKLSQKIKQWHATWIEGCQERLFMCDPRWVKKTKNLVPGDIVWMIKDSKLTTTLKWGLVTKVYPDQEGVVRDVMLRYALLKPTAEPYIAPYTRKGPFKEKIVAVQTLAIFYSAEEQAFDKNRLMGQTDRVISTMVDIMTAKDQVEDALPEGASLEEVAPVGHSMMTMRHFTRRVGVELVDTASEDLEEDQRVKAKGTMDFPDREGSSHPPINIEQVTWPHPDHRGSASNICSETGDSISDISTVTTGPEDNYKVIVTNNDQVIVKPDKIPDTAGDIVDRSVKNQPFRGKSCKGKDEPTKKVTSVNNNLPGTVGPVNARIESMKMAKESFKDEVDVKEAEFLFRKPEKQLKASELDNRVIHSVIERLHRVLDVHDDELGHEHDHLLLVAGLVEGSEGSRWSRLVKAQGVNKEQGDEKDSVIIYADLGLELTVKQIHAFYTEPTVTGGPSLGKVTNNSVTFIDSLNSDCCCTIISRMGDMFELFSAGPRSQTHMVDGKPVSILYGDSNAVEQALKYGEHVLRMPASWLTLNDTWRPLLHLTKSDVRGANWPFLKFSVRSSTLILPFEEVMEEMLEALVLVIPIQFVVPSVAQAVIKFTDEIKRQGGYTRNKFYTNAVHITLVKAGKHNVVKFCSEFRELEVPACLVLASQSAVASCGAAQ